MNKRMAEKIVLGDRRKRNLPPTDAQRHEAEVLLLRRGYHWDQIEWKRKSRKNKI